MRKLRSPLDRLYEKIEDSSNPKACWLWKASFQNHGLRYGRFWLNGKTITAHRAMWILTFGSIQDELEVCHSCDNPSCVNPNHLWLGTRHQNIADRNAKGRTAKGNRNGAYTHPESRRTGNKNGLHRDPSRAARGERNGNSKLTADQVVTIRRLHRTGKYGYSTLGRLFNVDQGTVANVVKQRTWRHIISGG